MFLAQHNFQLIYVISDYLNNFCIYLEIRRIVNQFVHQHRHVASSIIYFYAVIIPN